MRQVSVVVIVTLILRWALLLQSLFPETDRYTDSCWVKSVLNYRTDEMISLFVKLFLIWTFISLSLTWVERGHQDVLHPDVLVESFRYLFNAYIICCTNVLSADFEAPCSGKVTWKKSFFLILYHHIGGLFEWAMSSPCRRRLAGWLQGWKPVSQLFRPGSVNSSGTTCISHRGLQWCQT